MVEKIVYYLKHEEERQTIAQKGQKHCLEGWNMKDFAKKLKKIIDEHLA